MADLNKSLDIIGDLAMIEIPKGLQIHDRIIGEALMRVNRHVKAVFRKESAMEGEYRVRRIRHIAGEDRSETIYRESGVDMELDISKVYFSVRLSTERKRISDLVGPMEKVLVLFAGVGPFALVIGKRHPDSRITAVELNPDAVAYMRKNVSRNRLRNIEVIEGDAMDFNGTGFDRIVMPLPKSAIDFLPIALSSVREGGIVHLYTFASTKGDPVEEALVKARSIAGGSGTSISLIRGRIVRPYAPNIVQVVLDIRVSKVSKE
jgi:tRNA (guanine37-N1)-methyltransferase